jgi:hypothetical protein
MKGEMGRACSTYKESRNAYMILVGRPDGKKILKGSEDGVCN